jgi:hypothetical protein
MCQMADVISGLGTAFTLVTSNHDLCAQTASTAPSEFALLRLKFVRIEADDRLWWVTFEMQVMKKARVAEERAGETALVLEPGVLRPAPQPQFVSGSSASAWMAFYTSMAAQKAN